ncbi:MAG: hypothetical protein IJE40_05535 [Clostridia bacterium]|nr:hypothetical protein [Clostridia bacterium]
MKITKIITFILFSVFLLSVLSFTAFAKIEETDLDDSSKFYYRVSKEFTEDFISCIYGTEEVFTTDVFVVDECKSFLVQAACFLKNGTQKNPKEYYELNFSFNDIELDRGGGNIHLTADVKFLKAGDICEETINMFIRIGFPQKVIAITDAYIVSDAKLEKILYSENSEPMTLQSFVTWASENNSDSYISFADKLKPYTNYNPEILPDIPQEYPLDEDYFISSPETFDISMIFYILAAISAVFSCSTFRRKV